MAFARADAYAALESGKEYLGDSFTIGETESDTMSSAEALECEKFAFYFINDSLGKQFDINNLAETIREIAKLMAAYKAHVIKDQSLGADESYTQGLYRRGTELIKKLQSGAMGLLQPDGRWDPDYPQPRTARGTNQWRVITPGGIGKTL